MHSKMLGPHNGSRLWTREGLSIFKKALPRAMLHDKAEALAAPVRSRGRRTRQRAIAAGSATSIEARNQNSRSSSLNVISIGASMSVARIKALKRAQHPANRKKRFVLTVGIVF
jgi:hypothetical protein